MRIFPESTVYPSSLAEDEIFKSVKEKTCSFWLSNGNFRAVKEPIDTLHKDHGVLRTSDAPLIVKGKKMGTKVSSDTAQWCSRWWVQGLELERQ